MSISVVGTFVSPPSYRADSSKGTRMKFQTMAVVFAMGLATTGAAVAQDQPTPNPVAPANPAMKSPDDTAAAPLAKGHNSFTKSQALARIRKAGYSQVTELALDSDGLWQANATRDGQSVKVALDYKGDVAAQQ